MRLPRDDKLGEYGEGRVLRLPAVARDDESKKHKVLRLPAVAQDDKETQLSAIGYRLNQKQNWLSRLRSGRQSSNRAR